MEHGILDNKILKMKNKLILPCIRSVMGDWVIYTSAMDAKEIAKRVKTDKKYRENDDLDKILQRDLKDRRTKIAKYLLTDKSRFFNSIIIGVFGGIPQWHEFQIDKKISEINGDSEVKSHNYNIGLLEFIGDEEMFAIDGQHRVAGIQIAFEEEKKKADDKKVLNDDKFPVIFIAHIDDDLGRKRTRKLFSDINNNARPVADGDKIKVDEENLNAIVTRRIYANYKHFKKGKLISLTESAKLESKDNEHFTNLLGINNTNKVLRKIFNKKPRSKEWDEENVKIFYSIVEEFYDYAIKSVKDYEAFFVNHKLTIAKARDNNKYLLFRPVGLKLLAGLYVHFHQKVNGLKVLTKKLESISFVLPNSPYNGVLWNNGKMEAKSSNQKLALDLSLYILGEYPESKKSDLLEKYREVMKNEEIELPEIIK